LAPVLTHPTIPLMIEREAQVSPIAAPAYVSTLSRREVEIVSLAAEGLTNTQIAGRLGVTVHAVKFHLGSIYRKLHVANRTEAAVAYLQYMRA
jgi:DNA-binding CsgD family transcriptional regulator